MSTAVVIQARMGSSRLPGKSLAELGTSTVLGWVVRRAQQADLVDDVIVATTTEPIDDPISERLTAGGVTVVRGHPTDVLSRYALALAFTPATQIVRVTADCPFVDPAIIDAAIDRLQRVDPVDPASVDYISTSLDGRYPRGLDVEVVRRDVLEAADREATDPDEREHVTLFVYRRPDRFRCEALPPPAWARRPDLRFTIDEQDDLELARQVVAGLPGGPDELTGERIIEFLDAHPGIAAINRSVEHRNIT